MVDDRPESRRAYLTLSWSHLSGSLLETVSFPREHRKIDGSIYAELTIKLVDDRKVTVSIGRPFNQSGARYAESTARPDALRDWTRCN